MGLKQSIKQTILASSMEKRKKANPFNIEYSDRYQIPPNADEYHNNSQYFSVHDIENRRSLFFRLAVRGGGAAAELWLVYNDGQGGPVYVCAQDHYLRAADCPGSVECVTAGKKLRVRFSGDMKRARADGKSYAADGADDADIQKAELDLTFSGITEPFEFSRHMSTRPVARALAREKFTKDFRAALEENHQVHFEQLGAASGTLTLAGTAITFDGVPCFRDHSYGRRDWAYMNRHLWLVGVLEDGSFFHTSLVRYPAVNHLQTGFFYEGAFPNGSEGDAGGVKTVCLSRAAPMDDFAKDGAGLPGKGIPPVFGYQVEYEDGKTRRFHCELDYAVRFFHGGGSYLINEGVTAFTVDGVKGRGITEFGYNTSQY